MPWALWASSKGPKTQGARDQPTIHPSMNGPMSLGPVVSRVAPVDGVPNHCFQDVLARHDIQYIYIYIHTYICVCFMGWLFIYRCWLTTCCFIVNQNKIDFETMSHTYHTYQCRIISYIPRPMAQSRTLCLSSDVHHGASVSNSYSGCRPTGTWPCGEASRRHGLFYTVLWLIDWYLINYIIYICYYYTTSIMFHL